MAQPAQLHAKVRQVKADVRKAKREIKKIRHQLKGGTLDRKKLESGLKRLEMAVVHIPPFKPD